MLLFCSISLSNFVSYKLIIKCLEFKYLYQIIKLDNIVGLHLDYKNNTIWEDEVTVSVCCFAEEVVVTWHKVFLVLETGLCLRMQHTFPLCLVLLYSQPYKRLSAKIQQHSEWIQLQYSRLRSLELLCCKFTTFSNYFTYKQVWFGFVDC